MSLRLTGVAIAIIAAPVLAAPGPLPPPNLAKYVDPLPIPPRLVVGDAGSIDVTLSQFQAKLHRDLPELPVWGYNGSSPGPMRHHVRDCAESPECATFASSTTTVSSRTRGAAS